MARRKPQAQPLDMQPNNSYPLTDEHCIIIDGVLSSCALVKEVIDKLARCGFDVASYDAVNSKQAEQAVAIKSEFFPDLL